MSFIKYYRYLIVYLFYFIAFINIITANYSYIQSNLIESKEHRTYEKFVARNLNPNNSVQEHYMCYFLNSRCDKAGALEFLFL